SGGTINNVSYALPTACIFNWNQYGAEGITINFVNPTPVLPAQNGAAPKVVNRSIGGLTNLTKCFFYDASADTYTDYTTASTNATADDVPLNGDVGDCLYFNNSTWQNYWQIALAFTITNQSNDYVYAWAGKTGVGLTKFIVIPSAPY
ncbi:hypothetical protein M1437_03270, partial [Patescibacteria group bacterium]|nr:hypothetical protein [Patescibacteria group bacterium]